jgi:chemotaxis protein MotB
MRRWRTRFHRRTDASMPVRRVADNKARRRGVLRSSAIVCCVLLPMLSACVTQGTHDQAIAQRDQLEAKRKKLARELELLEAANVSLTNERDKLFNEFEDQRISSERLEVDVRRLTSTRTKLAQNLEQTTVLLARREAEIAAIRGTYDALVGDLQEELAAGQIEIERLSSGLNLNLSQGVLFAKASASVSPAGEEVLKKLAARLRKISYEVEIIGHTDNVPIGVRFPSNWELAGARASSVVRLLAASGVDPARMSAVSRGEFDPVASNDTAEGRASNRRIEIRLTPGSTGGAAAAATNAKPEPETGIGTAPGS